MGNTLLPCAEPPVLMWSDIHGNVRLGLKSSRGVERIAMLAARVAVCGYANTKNGAYAAFKRPQF